MISIWLLTVDKPEGVIVALLTVDYFSPSLMRTTTLEVILPIDSIGDAMATDSALVHDPEHGWEQCPYPAGQSAFKTLYLLHGISGNHGDWISESRIRSWAEERHLAVVMPSGYNAFYLDNPDSHNYYGRFVGKELVAVTRRMFPLSHRREDTFIGGISMGAYGAMRNGLKYCETFGNIISLSTAMAIDNLEYLVSDNLFFLRRSFLESNFGDLHKVANSDKDPVRLAADLVYCDRPRPRLYVACGNQDPLLEANRIMVDRIRGIGLDVTYSEDQGGHDWNYWNEALPRALDWLPKD